LSRFVRQGGDFDLLDMSERVGQHPRIIPQCDHMAHMNVMWYVGKFDEATWQLMAKLGLSPSCLKNEGLGMVAVEQQIAYKRELYPGDVITIRSSVQKIKDKSIRFTHEMTNDETGNWLHPPFLSEFASIWRRGGRLHCQRVCVQVPLVSSMAATSRMPGSRATRL